MSSESANPFQQQDALLGEPTAKVVSTLSTATRLSLKATTLVLDALFAGARYGTSASLALSRRTLVAALSSARLMNTSRIDQDSSEDEGLAELFAFSAFHITSTASTSALRAADETVRIIDGLFGSTETSRALAAIVQIIKREFVEDEDFSLGNTGKLAALASVAKALTAFACLQVVTWRRSGRGEQGVQLVLEREYLNGQPMTDTEWSGSTQFQLQHHESKILLAEAAVEEEEKMMKGFEVAFETASDAASIITLPLHEPEWDEGPEVQEVSSDCDEAAAEADYSEPVIVEPPDRPDSTPPHLDPSQSAGHRPGFAKRLASLFSRSQSVVMEDEVESETIHAQDDSGVSLRSVTATTRRVTVTETDTVPGGRSRTRTMLRQASRVSLISSSKQTPVPLITNSPARALLEAPDRFLSFPNIPIEQLAYRYMRHASAAYGPQFLHILGISSAHIVDSYQHHPNHATYAKHTDISVKDIVMSSYTPATAPSVLGRKPLHALVHYVSYDRQAKAVVLTLRGTMGLSDVLTDLCADYTVVEVDFGSGKRKFNAHGGMLEGAKICAALHSDILRCVREALLREPDYGLVLTGHSLGAGVAALLAALWSCKDEDNVWRTSPASGLPPGRRIHCCGYGMPCVMSCEMGRSCSGLITSVINSDDVVPYLSLGIARDFRNVAVSLYEEPDVAEEIVKRCVGYIERDEDWFWSLIKTMRASMCNEKLYPPGDVYIASWSSVSAVNGDHLEERITSKLVHVTNVEERFGEVVFAKGMFTDHSPKFYEDCLRILAGKN